MLRALETSEPLDRYLEIKAEIERLSEELELLKPEITAALWTEPENRTIYRGCEISLGERRTYAYSDKVQELEKVLSEAKAYERSHGIAECKRHTSFPVVKVLPQIEAAA